MGSRRSYDERIDNLIAQAKAKRGQTETAPTLVENLTREQKSQARKEEASIAKKLKMEKGYRPLQLSDEAFIEDLKIKLEAKSGKIGT